MSTPKVSIVCITYNHEKYIAKALDSFLMQKTDFPIELIIANDCSTDRTASIVEDYEKRFPDRIVFINREKNIGIQSNCKDAFLHAKGDYIAWCEGDDFWTDPDKLQKQVNLMEKNKDNSLVFHPVKVFYENGEHGESTFPDVKKINNFTLEELLKNNFIQSSSVMYRKLNNYNDIPLDVLPLDWYLHILHANNGKICFINEIMSAYRRHENGVWWDSGKGHVFWEKHGSEYIALFSALKKLAYGFDTAKDILNSQIVDMYNRLITIDLENNAKNLNHILEKHPSTSSEFMVMQAKSIQHASDNLKIVENEIRNLQVLNSISNERIEDLHSSKSFQLGHFLLHPLQLVETLMGLLLKSVRMVMTLPKRKRADAQIRTAYKEARDRIRSHGSSTEKTVVILHLYYPDMWGYFSERLNRLNDYEFDLYITLPTKHTKLTEKIQSQYPNACILVVPNRGRDVLPFLNVLEAVRQKNYKYVLKLHSKKSKHREDGQDWMEQIIEELIPQDTSILDSLFSVLDNRSTAIVGPQSQYLSLMVNFDSNRHQMKQILKNYEHDKTDYQKLSLERQNYGFFAGTMFWARMDNLPKLEKKYAQAQFFEQEDQQIDGTLAHAIERLLVVLPRFAKKRIYGMSEGGVEQINTKIGQIPSWSELAVEVETHSGSDL